MTYSDVPGLTYHDLLCLPTMLTYQPIYCRPQPQKLSGFPSHKLTPPWCQSKLTSLSSFQPIHFIHSSCINIIRYLSHPVACKRSKRGFPVEYLPISSRIHPRSELQE